MEYRDRIGEIEPTWPVSRYAPVPWPYMVVIRERVNDDGTVDVVSKKRVYCSILGSSWVVPDDEPILDSRDGK